MDGTSLRPRRAWLVFLISALVAWGAIGAPAAWDPDQVLPHFSFPKANSSSERQAAEALREEMIHSLGYWQQRGLPQPAPIDAMLYISSYQNLRLNDLLQALNPDIPNVQQHVLEQYQHFQQSDLFAILTEVEERMGVEEGTLTTRFFDNYAHLRYGFDVPDFVYHVANDSDLADIPGKDSHPTDNAYYSGTPSVDLTDVLPLHFKSRKITSLFLSLMSGEADEDKVVLDLIRKVGIHPRITRRVVVLPRLTGRTGNTDISTLNDPSVLTHELGHHMVATLSEKTVAGGVPLLVNEAMADYLAASQSENPLIGEFFAKASARIAKRLAGNDDPEAQLEAYHMAQIARKGALRDLRQVYTIDDVERSVSIGEAHIDGHPIRSFLWTLRQSKVGKAKVDEVALQAIKEMTAMPMVVSDDAMEHIHLRGFFLRAKKLYLIESAVKQLAVQAVLETGRHRFTREEVKTWKAQAKIIAAKILQEQEEHAKEMRNRKYESGGRPFRMLVAADYVVPEFFRAFYRAAQALHYDDVAEAARAEAGELMHATAVAVKLADGSGELAFFRKGELSTDPSTIAKLTEVFEARRAIAKQIKDIPDETPRKQAQEQVEPLLKRYGAGLDRLVAFERSGLPERLEDPRMHTEWIHAIARKVTERQSGDEDEPGLAAATAGGTERSAFVVASGCLRAWGALKRPTGSAIRSK